MLSAKDNENLTRVGRGTPMGNLLRKYWLPVMPVEELGEPDGDPQRFKLLGEDLVLFRDSAGNVGVFPEACPHRGVSLYHGRNEQNGIRCIYHGWKFDVTGQCVDMPNEPGESNFRDKVRATTYRAAVHGGVIWAYLGSGEAPGLPQFEWTMVPGEQRNFSLAQRNCNWVQGLEGDIDTSHLFFLHGRLNPDDSPSFGVWHDDKHPTLDIIPTGYGVVYGANREEDDATTYWRITQFLFPIFAFFPAAAGWHSARSYLGAAGRPPHHGLDGRLASGKAALWSECHTRNARQCLEPRRRNAARLHRVVRTIPASRQPIQRLRDGSRGAAHQERHRHRVGLPAGSGRYGEHGSCAEPHHRTPGTLGRHDYPSA